MSTPPGEIIAMVNGRPIRRLALVEMLIESHGVRLLEELILLEAARQRAADRGIEVTLADVHAAHEDALRRLRTPLDEAADQPLDRQAAERLIEEFMVSKNVSHREWDCRMEQQAICRKIAQLEVGKMQVTEKMLHEEYALAYGEQVQVRHIQVSSLAASARVRRLLEQGKDFELVARQQSENLLIAARGGLLPPFTTHDPTVPPIIREAAFAMKVGDVSPPIREENWYHFIRVEKRIPARGTGFEHADKDALRQHLVDRLVAQRQDTLEAELFRSAIVDIRDETLRRLFHQRYPQRGGR